VVDECIRFEIRIGRHLSSVWEHRIIEKLEEASGVENIYNGGWRALPNQFLDTSLQSLGEILASAG